MRQGVPGPVIVAFGVQMGPGSMNTAVSKISKTLAATLKHSTKPHSLLISKLGSVAWPSGYFSYCPYANVLAHEGTPCMDSKRKSCEGS